MISSMGSPECLRSTGISPANREYESSAISTKRWTGFSPRARGRLGARRYKLYDRNARGGCGLAEEDAMYSTRVRAALAVFFLFIFSAVAARAQMHSNM